MSVLYNRYLIALFVLVLLIPLSARPEMGKELAKAVYLVKSGDHKLAIKFCNKVLEHNPKSYQAHYIKGFAYYQLEDFDEAIESFNKTIAVQPEHADAYYYRGICKRQKGKIWAALQDLRKANSLNPGGTQSSLLKEVVKAIF